MSGKNEAMASVKPGVDHEAGAAVVCDFTQAEEAAVRRKVDLYLLPMLWCMYLFSYADRTK